MQLLGGVASVDVDPLEKTSDSEVEDEDVED